MRSERGGIVFKLLVVLGLVLFCLILYLSRHAILRTFANAWLIDDRIEKSDAILLLGDDNFAADRATHAAFLFRQGMAPLIVGSGRRLRPYAGIAELMEHDLIERGVPKEAIVRFPQIAENTREESQQLLKLVKDRRWRRVIVVTSSVDARRVRYIFRHVFPKAIEVQVSGARDLDFDADHWWESRRGVKQMFHEVSGMVVAIWELHGSSGAGIAPQSLVGLGASFPLDIVSLSRKHPRFAAYHSPLHSPEGCTMFSRSKSQRSAGPACIATLA